MEPFSAWDFHALRNTEEGEQKLQRLLSAEACRLENLLISQLSRTSSWDIPAVPALAPWNCNAAITEQLLLEERLRAQLEMLTSGRSEMSTPSSENSVEASCIAQCIPQHDVTERRSSGGAEEGILDVRVCGDRRLFVRVTLYASGFVIGPKGKSIRKIEILSRCRISSSVIENEAGRKIRLFCIDGDKGSREIAYRTVAAAVARYKVLCDSTLARMKVEHVQHIEGVKFYYYPPPKSRGQATSDVASPSAVAEGVF